MRPYRLAWTLAILLFSSFVVAWSGSAAAAVLGHANPMIFWRNISTGENTVWYMDGSTQTATATFDPLAGPWRMVATADFNSDGEADILWRNMSTGGNMVWYMNGATHTGSVGLAPLADQTWKIAGVADFNNDGNPDILWRNMSTGGNMVWYMNGATHTGSVNLDPVADPIWEIAGAADFNRDGNPDIVWRNSATGQNVVWYMEDSIRTGVALLDTVTPDWEMIVGTTDLNRDGRLDILWRNTGTGANMVWYMYGATHTSADLTPVTDQNMEMAGQGNYSVALPITGVCGSSNGGTFASAPTSNLCSAGAASAVMGSGPWIWTCAGWSGGTNASCQANQPNAKIWTVTPSAGSNGAISPNTQQTVNDGVTKSFTITPNAGYTASVSGSCGGAPSSGTAPFIYTTNPITADCTVTATFTSLPPSGVCGLANGGIFTSAPTTDLCSAGTASAVSGSDLWTWTCQGANSTAQCQAHIKTWTVTPSAGSNGSIILSTPQKVNNGSWIMFTVFPGASYSAIVGGTCGGTLTGNVYITNPITADCTVAATFTQSLDGVCGSANGGIFMFAPYVNLCSAGIESTVTGSGPWIWTCQGTSSTTQCQANPMTWTVTGSVTGGNGTISCTSPINNGLFSTCTMSPNKGYRLATLIDNSDVTNRVSGSVYAITRVTHNHVVIASFVPRGPFIFWRDYFSGENTLWYMNGSTHAGTASLDRLTGPWRVVGSADFNSDGQPDILWRNTVTGANMVWYMDEITHTGSADLTPVADQNWKIAAVADFNSDGKVDILWRNISTGANMVRYMNGITHTGSADLTPITDQNWEIMGAVDVNKDGNPDIFWRNGATGQNVVWYLEGITRTGLAFLDTVTDQNWKMIVGATDLNKDGNPDILWRNTATGQNSVWYMNGATHTGSADLEIVTDQNMEIAGQDNYSPSPAGNYVYLQSDPGDHIGDGQTYTYTQSNALLSVTATGGRLLITIKGDEQWTGNFQTPNSITQLQPGYYGNLQRFYDPAYGSLDWYGTGGSNNTLTGWFAVDSVTYVNGVLTAIDLRFEQHSDGASPALHGEIHWNANDPTVPPGPINPPPAGLWEPAPGSTPPAGNYVYLKSDPGDTIGAGLTYTFTQANARLSVTATWGHLSVSIYGNDYWSGYFRTMDNITQLQPGYYGDLQRYLAHNPAKGGLVWYGDGSPPTLTGWFTIDSVTYANGVLTAIDLRFEQHNQGGSPALHGEIHWSQ